MMSPVLVSRLPVGSSARMSAGSLMRARAMATRWICPPESWLDRWVQCDSSSPALRRASSARSSRSARGTPEYTRGSTTLRITVARGSRLNCWKTNPMRSAPHVGKFVV